MLEIKLNSKNNKNPGFVALIDDSDFNLINGYTWYVKVYKNRDVVYARAFVRDENGKSKSIILHRLILGVTDPKVIVDHEDGNGLNCQRNNLREATIAQNNANVGSRKNSTSSYLGVHKKGNTEKYIAQITKNNQTTRIGCFNSEIIAAQEYDKKALELHGVFAKLNFPQK